MAQGVNLDPVTDQPSPGVIIAFHHLSSLGEAYPRSSTVEEAGDASKGPYSIDRPCLSAKLALKIYAQPSVNNAMPLFAFVSQTRKLDDADIEQLVG